MFFTLIQRMSSLNLNQKFLTPTLNPNLQFVCLQSSIDHPSFAVQPGSIINYNNYKPLHSVY